MIEITRILCPVDFSEFSRRALDHAEALARWYEARLTVLCVLPRVEPLPFELAGGPDPASGPTADDRERATAALQRFVGHVPPDVPIDLAIRESSAVDREILAHAEAVRADLLVIGSHGRSGFQRLLLGSVSEKVIRYAACPVMVVPGRAPDADPHEPVRFRRILCPVDFSAGSLDALRYAIDLAEESDSQLTLLHAIEVPPELQERTIPLDFNVDAARAAAEAECLRRLRDLVPAPARTYCTVETVAVEGSAHREILRQAAERTSDLIVMGVHGRGRIDRLLFGSNTQHVIRTAACPVLVVRLTSAGTTDPAARVA